MVSCRAVGEVRQRAALGKGKRDAFLKRGLIALHSEVVVRLLRDDVARQGTLRQ